MAVTADLLRNRCDFHRERVIGAAQLADEFFDRYLVLADQLAFPAPLLRITENVECGATQTAQLRQQLECSEHPGAVLRLAQFARSRIALCKKRRRQMEVKFVVAFKPGLDLLHESRIGVQPRHFVLVLVGKQLEVVARNRFGEPAKPLGL